MKMTNLIDSKYHAHKNPRAKHFGTMTELCDTDLNLVIDKRSKRTTLAFNQLHTDEQGTMAVPRLKDTNTQTQILGVL